MIYEEQDTRLARLLGWRRGSVDGFPWTDPEGDNQYRHPNYGASLDAMYSVETELARRGLTDTYVDVLAVLHFNPEWMRGHYEPCQDEVFAIIHATATEKRAAALQVLEGAVE